MDMCVKSEPEDEHISHTEYCTEVQGFGAEEMGSGLHLDTEHIKSEIVMVKIMEDNADLHYRTTETLCPPSQQPDASACLLFKQYKSQTGDVKVEQHSQLQEPCSSNKEISKTDRNGVKEEYTDLQVHELKLSSVPCPLSQQYKSETEEVKLELHSQLQKSSCTEKESNEVVHYCIKEECADLYIHKFTTFPCPLLKQCKSEIGAANKQIHSEVQRSCSTVPVFSQAFHLKQNQISNGRKERKYCQDKKTTSSGNESKKGKIVNSIGKPYACSECGKSFSRGDHLKEHQRVHSGEKPYKCSECGKSFSRGYNLKLHQRAHSGEKPYKCSECGKSFSRGYNLEQHYLIHSGEKPYGCTECGMSFSQANHLKHHQLIHSGEKPYKCSQCGRRFSRSYHLKHHQLIHSGEKPYKCSQCGRRFSQSYHLKQHELVHSGEKPYKCSECGKRFSRGNHLERHQHIHSGEKPYKCSNCGKHFALMEYLKKHAATH